MMAVRLSVGNAFPYDALVEREDIPVHKAEVGIDDITLLPRAPWARTEGYGAFIELLGTFQSQRGVYVLEIPGGQALAPEKHLYEEEMFVLQGRGLSQVWQGDGPKLTFEWGQGSVFAFPRNTSHRLFNAGPDPVLLLGVTTAPEVVNAVLDLDFIFNCDYQFTDLYQDGESYFAASDKKTTEGWYEIRIWHTNFIADAKNAFVDDMEQKVAGGQLTGYRMGPRFPHGHISEWPTGHYHKAHYHGPGAVLLGLEGEGYVLAWPAAWGTQPYQAGYGDKVFKVNWGRNSIYSPPNAYYHQHFNACAGPARHVAVYGAELPLGVHAMYDGEVWTGNVSSSDGGTLIDYKDEDPEIRRDFEATLRQKGIASHMPSSLYV
jgi:quercetin dioxygenase-like cupin family protein